MASGGDDKYVVVSQKDDAASECIEVPLNADDNTLGLQTLRVVFPNAIGLKFKNAQTGAYRTLLMDPTGSKLYPPQEGWDNKVFFVISADRHQYVVVSEKDDAASERVEVPLNPADGNTLGLQTLRAVFPNATGLKFKNPLSGAYRTLLMDPTGSKLYPPQGSWDGKLFFVIAAAPSATTGHGFGNEYRGGGMGGSLADDLGTPHSQFRRN